MEEMNQFLNLQERFEVSQEANIKVHQSLCELISSLIHYFKLPHQERLESRATRLLQEHKDKWRSLNWDNPIQEECKTVTKILKTQTELLQQDYHQGRDASRQLLMALLRSLWRYFMFHSQGRICLTTNFTSLNNHSEWKKFHEAILRLSASLQRNIPERGAAFKQDVKTILYHLKKCKTQDSGSTR
ncbi:uncharacterized protein LOC110048086 isoform X2 [Orbicella faveolata]|uniref:uncharacterized protein LOC110048086 isoform X2 n=1 Tax=Orbicella faveolata TaxID=48498 RepID=UPI0009E4A54E|nr:uncharacterized protein LOC110048086 isoform X2 [Orbicella faveolata]